MQVLKKHLNNKEYIIIGVVTILFAFVSVFSITTIQHTKGNARVVNYVGIVRGATQKLVKKELMSQPDDALIKRLDSIIIELIMGEGSNNLIVLNDDIYLNNMRQVQRHWEEIKALIAGVRVGEDPRILYESSEEYFTLVDRTVSSAEVFSERQIGKSINTLIGVNIAVIFIIATSFVLLVKSATIRTKIEKDLIESKENADSANKAKSVFLSNMSHEIRTPMNGVLGMIRLVLNTDLNAKQQEYLSKAMNSAENLLHIINDILDFSKIEAGKLNIEHIAFNLKKIIFEIRDIFAYEPDYTGPDLKFKISDDIDDIVIGDPHRLKQVLINMVNNAFKFTQEGTINVMIMVKEPMDMNGSMLYQFSVSDTGIGMTKEQLGKLFSPFIQADLSSTRLYGGTGLGLAISKNLVEQMGGRIWVESELQQGTTFYFTIRFQTAVSTLHNRDIDIYTQQNNAAGNSVNKQFKLLLVEDNEINQIIAKELLESEGYIVDVADNGELAINALKQSNYSAVLMDIQMPVMDGYTATTKIRKNEKWSDLPIIAMSANAMKDDIEKSLQSGMNAHLSKPINLQDTLKILERYLNRL